MKEATAFFRLLGDEARLRILRLLERERLNVSELTSILGIAQPGVSRHLRLLKEGGLVLEERDRGWTYYGLAPAPAEMARAWGLLRREIRGAGRHGGRRPPPGDPAPPQGGLHPRAGARPRQELGRLGPRARPPPPAAPRRRPGLGEGYLALEAARWAKHVVAVDVSERALEGARALAQARSIRNISFKKGEIEDLPLESGSVDVALLSQALHHAKDPGQAVREAARILAPGGTLLLLDLKAHKEEWVKKLGDKWMGFDEESLRKMMRDAGLKDLEFEIGASKRGDPFQVIVASGKKPR